MITDGWSAYKKLSEKGFEHAFVNHSIEFVRSDNPNIHTNNVEGNWWVVKRFLPSSGRYSLTSHLPVFMWYNKCLKTGKSTFWELLELVKRNNNPALVNVKSISNLNVENIDGIGEEDETILITMKMRSIFHTIVIIYMRKSFVCFVTVILTMILN